MAHIILDNVNILLPIFNQSSKAIISTTIRKAIGGSVAMAESKTMFVEALKNITLDIREGDRIGLIGHNGAGKSTLLKLLSRIYEPTTGNLEICGSAASLLSIAAGMNAEISGEENIYLKCIMLGIKTKDIPQIVKTASEATQLDHFIKLPVRTYSSGMKLRLAFTISTLSKPDILLLDEAVAVGDKAFKEHSMSQMKVLLENTKITVLATHVDSYIKQFCNKVVWLENGHIKAAGEPNETLELYNK